MERLLQEAPVPAPEPVPAAPEPRRDLPGPSPAGNAHHDFSALSLRDRTRAVGSARRGGSECITSMTLDLGTSTIRVDVDDGTTLVGQVAETRLTEGDYHAHWDTASHRMVIDPWPEGERAIHFGATGNSHFLPRFVALQKRLSAPVPLVVVSTAPEPVAQEDSAEGGIAIGRNGEPMTFPLRLPMGLWRLDVAPITAYRDGEEIVVSQPVNAVFGNAMFKREVETLPLSTFLGGVRLKPGQLVRVRLYDEGEQLVWVTGEEMLALSQMTERALMVSAGTTVVDAASFFIPAGAVGNAAMRVLRPLGTRVLRPLATRALTPVLRAARTAVVATGLGIGEAAPVAMGRAASPALVEVFEQGAAREVTAGASGQALGAGLEAAPARVASEAAAAAAPRASSAAVRAGASGTEMRVSAAQWTAILSHVYASHFFDLIHRFVGEIAMRAATQVASEPRFLDVVRRGRWNIAGTYFHSAAKKVALEFQKSGQLPPGWEIKVEERITHDGRVSRLDLVFLGPNGERYIYDWKTRGASAFEEKAVEQMDRYNAAVANEFGGPVDRVESRSWFDFVRELIPNVKWPGGLKPPKP